MNDIPNATVSTPPLGGRGLRVIMFVGTGSDVGKSVISAAFCRIFLQDGYCPAPFKAQNMSLNSFATPDGLEIGRAQAVQAEACGIPCSVEMNPVLLKPTNYTTSQVVLNGKPAGNKSALQYFNETDRDGLFNEAMKSCYRLMENHNPVVIEGAGSISEINLWDRDITNMRVAETLNAPTYLIADIDRGGVFASVFGTIELLPQNQRDLIKGIIINKFRGDISLFDDGRKMLEKIIGKPVVGIIPYFNNIYIEQEDSVVIDNARRNAESGKINIAVVLLRHMSNFTDFDMLEHHPDVNLYYTASSDELSRADIILLPGSKNTISDLIYLRNNVMAKAIIEEHKKGKAVYGICGGFQMMGESIQDPLGIEGEIYEIHGLGILPVKTIITQDKKTEQCTFKFLDGTEANVGYEIHMGVTSADKSSPLCKTNGRFDDGYFLNSKTFGTYIHGFFDNAETVQYILNQVEKSAVVEFDHRAFKEEQYNKLAQHVRNHVDLEYIYKTMELDD